MSLCDARGGGFAALFIFKFVERNGKYICIVCRFPKGHAPNGNAG